MIHRIAWGGAVPSNAPLNKKDRNLHHSVICNKLSQGAEPYNSNIREACLGLAGKT